MTAVEVAQSGQQGPAKGPTQGQRAAADKSFAAGARMLSVGIASTGLFTFAYLAVASHLLDRIQYSRVSLCWSIMFVILSVIYRPIEQLLSRTIAERHALGAQQAGSLRTPALLQASFATVFLIVALVLHHVIEHDIFDGSSGLYWILLVGVVAYAASYFARGWLAGSRRFALYGSLVFLESTSRFLFALAAAVGISSGQDAIGLGMAAAPFVSLCVIPFALQRVSGRAETPVTGAAAVVDVVATGAAVADVVATGATAAEGIVAPDEDDSLSLRRGGRFAGGVLAIMLSEQALINAGVIVVAASSGFDLTSGLTGFVFNVMLIVRAPLQLFQAVQTSILPHLTGMKTRDDADEFHHTVRLTVLLALGFGVSVAIGLLAVGPPVMHVLVGDKGFTYGRLGLAAVGLGMGLHLCAGIFNQALLARERAGLSACAWLTTGLFFVLFVALGPFHDKVTRTEVGYLAATALLAALLRILYTRTGERPAL